MNQQFLVLCEKLKLLHQAKAHDYGLGQDPLANLRACQEFGLSPVVGVFLRMNDKMTRLKAFSQRGNLVNESVEDSLLDLASYSLLALILLEEEKQNNIVMERNHA